MRRVIIALVSLGLVTSCQETTAPTSTPTVPTATAPASAMATSAAVSEPAASCAPWAPSPRTLVVRSGGGRGDFFREYQYDFSSRGLGVHDSDPFAADDGTEAKDPRVLQQHKTVEPADNAKLTKALTAICPDAAAMSAACAPGGCSRLVVKHADGSETKVEHAETVSQVMKLFRPHFPELRGE
jgi:hypothetical protein